MKRFALIFSIAILTAGLVRAQQPMSNSTTDGENKSGKPELRTVVGCLSQTDDTYVITGGAPGPKQFRIVGGDTSALKGKVGQSVKVVGMVSEADPAEVAAPPYHEGSTAGATYETIVVQKVKILGGQCSFPGQEWTGDHE